MKKIFILDDDKDMADLLALFFEDEGGACVTTNSVKEMNNKLPEILSCDLALLDINLGADQPSGLEAYRSLADQKFSGKIIFFTGHAKFHPLVQEAAKIPGVEVMEKVADIKSLLSVLRNLK